MTDSISLAVQKRDQFGKKLKLVRQDGLVPAVLHNHGEESIHVSVDEAELIKVYAAAGKHHALELELDGKKHTALVKDVDYEPAKTKMRHVVFQLVNADEKIEAEIPIEFTGDSPAVKAGLQLNELMKSIEVRAIPSALVDKLVVSIEGLAEVGDSISIADVAVPEGIEILADPDQTIANIEAMVDREAEANAAAAEMAAETEVADTAEDGEAESAASEAEKTEETSE